MEMRSAMNRLVRCPKEKEGAVMALTETEYSLSVQTVYYDSTTEETVTQTKTFKLPEETAESSMVTLANAYIALVRNTSSSTYTTVKTPLDTEAETLTTTSKKVMK